MYDNLTNGELYAIAKTERDEFSSSISEIVKGIIDREDCILENNVSFINKDATINQTSFCTAEIASKVLQDNFGICDDGTYVRDVVITACSDSAENAATIAVMSMIKKFNLSMGESEIKEMIADSTCEFIPKVISE